MKLRNILERIKEINKVDFETMNSDESEYFFDWDGKITYEGIKRILYSLWNDGDNGQGDDLTYWFTPEAKVLYNKLLEDVKNIMTTEEKIAVMQAYVDGKPIEYSVGGGEWIELNSFSNVAWDWYLNDYREKVVSEYIPFDFSDAEFLIGKIIKRKNGNGIQIITKMTNGWVNDMNFQYMFDECSFLDGSPCGKIKQ